MKNNAPSAAAAISKEEAFYQLLKKERTYYRSLLEITRQEYALLHIPAIMPGWRSIPPLLKNKRTLLGCIKEIEHSLTPLKAAWHDKTCRTDSISTKIHGELEALDLLLEEILKLDLANQKQMEKQLSQLRKCT